MTLDVMFKQLDLICWFNPLILGHVLVFVWVFFLVIQNDIK